MDYTNLCLGCMEEKGAAKTCPRCGYVHTAVPESSHHLPAGTILQGKYLLGKVLGQGGFGITYIAWDMTLDLKLAIKEFFPLGIVARSAGKPSMEVPTGERGGQYRYGLERYLEEAKTLALFSEHPNIVTVRDFFKANGTAYMVMNYIEGLTLEEYLKEAGGKITFPKTLETIMPVLDALREVHRLGIMHRDISPDNIFIRQDGRVVLIDFGAARQEMREKSKSLSVILKAGYAPEEQYRSRGKQGPWTDIYAVAATMYRCITGQTPLEAIDRMAQDDLQPPSQLGVKIDKLFEKTLLKALAVKTEDRYQAVDDFQNELVAASDQGQAGESPVDERPKKPGEPFRAEVKANEEGLKEKAQAGVRVEAAGAPEKKPGAAQQSEERALQSEPSYTVSKKAVLTAAAAILCGLLIFGAFSFFSGGDDTADLSRLEANEKGYGDAAEEPPQDYDPAVIAGLDADYYIDYENGTIPIGDLPIGARVVDPSWEWEFRTDNNYSGSGKVKPVTWIIVAKDHYDGLQPHVTLLSEELIVKHAFDNSTNRGSQYGSNHWGESGTANATRGLRPWLNSTGIHSGEGFYRAFSESFQGAVLATTVPNKEWKNGNAYKTQDYIFLPSTTELGDSAHNYTYRIGSVHPYFFGVKNAKRIARLGDETWGYWTRSPDSDGGYYGRYVSHAGEFYYEGYYNYRAYNDAYGVRPALNLKSGILVSEIRK